MKPFGFITIFETKRFHMRRDVFQAIADPTRRTIISMLAERPLNVNDVSEHFEMSRTAVSKHMKILRECGLLSIEKRGRERYCHSQLSGLEEVASWVEQYRVFWNSRLDRLEALLRTENNDNKNN